jgi:hypothetical protein
MNACSEPNEVEICDGEFLVSNAETTEEVLDFMALLGSRGGERPLPNGESAPPGCRSDVPIV